VQSTARLLELSHRKATDPLREKTFGMVAMLSKLRAQGCGIPSSMKGSGPELSGDPLSAAESVDESHKIGSKVLRLLPMR
jgi:hypothetical protein